ncbi:gamma-glutamyl-gamma-aminobutyrate hydrolase family protein [Pontibacter akesuensis]|uniref:Putative glutamine amidotransferase n=1 Tax=Pontibacter akesuensis TaxID=388950 RepID=A0A1I7FI32_9BACT|nr:gamma-glutamyl-gamma-aminobutyrate hydrolase family protein [Pontibacter akesuensis]GHA62070.1 gamma-glutamyl-gamma-aminobutyrate hydrolase [Pontibacter akesuensis]SFU35847.1 putative glutamine amidotransferase [Pontibacter akesuensis]
MANLTKKYKIDRNRPTIGVTGPDKGGGTAWFFTAFGILLAGGWPVRITPSRPRTADGLQALVVGGGADVDPSTYEQDHVFDEYLQRTLKHPTKNIFQRVGRFARWLYYPALFLTRKLFSRKRSRSHGLDHARDHLEIQLIDQAVKKQLPILGICRGSQLLNVYFRGTLYQDINTFYLEEPNPSSIFPVKRVYIKEGSKLGSILGTRQLDVNALHNQAVKEPGKDIDIVAQEANQVVQGIENTVQEFVIGVQWHPEYLPQKKAHRRIFQTLVQHAAQVNQQIEERDMQEALAAPENEMLQAVHEQEEKLLQQQQNQF